MNARTYQAGQRYWSLHVAQERKKLERRGFTPSQIDAEISRYATAISRILHSQKQYGSTPDSAARPREQAYPSAKRNGVGVWGRRPPRVLVLAPRAMAFRGSGAHAR
ncbi:DUF6074 family protein [Mesorhizobium sp. M0199]|uniref:DUF6074 family protein n=1 Tax=Mesorhizobium sp. M0199 TaxID=2956911 RepID=UPI003338F0AF